MQTKDFFNEHFNIMYELALREGEKRFGKECKHEKIKNGRCVECFRKVVYQKVINRGK